MMIQVLIVHETRLMCSVIAAAFKNEPDIEVMGTATNLEEALPQLDHCEVILLRTSWPDHTALELTRAVLRANPDLKVVAIGLAESGGAILPYAEAGVQGYVLAKDSVEQLLETIRAVHGGEAHLSPDVAMALIARVAELSKSASPLSTPIGEGPSELTPREREVLELIAEDLSNAEIAERLSIELGTVKNHVHNILKKLGVSSREEATTHVIPVATGSK